MEIVILHGWGHNGDLWASLAKKLGKQAFSFDMPGFGSEKLTDENWGIPEYAKWVEKKIAKKKEIILIGHSFGGRVAAEIASKNPEWLKGLILSGAPCLYRPNYLIKIKIKIYKLFKAFLPNKFRSIFLSQELSDADKNGLGKIFRKVVIYDQGDKLKKISIPTLLIWGERDNSVPVNIAKEMNLLIKNSELKIIENSGHNTYLENPNLFYGYVKKFIENI